ncbi:MAG TPA: LLM class flavin-dependent oxidoreductase, partial [Jatrophihabitantaceae bacterium]|nr:LLM class flavin-dependent oxidoreductase [Jatrophihabitantaceae bacterium]
MSDYLQDLQFGAFLTPTAADATDIVELALLCDTLGLDLVTVQDHPYQKRFLDAWTLLSVIAAQTSSVRVAPNVANLPLRLPAVLARSVASLDILSNGRVELGLGAGAFWDAIAAMGGARRSAGEAVDALAAAIEVIRRTWRQGPPLAHPVEIW